MDKNILQGMMNPRSIKITIDTKVEDLYQFEIGTIKMFLEEYNSNNISKYNFIVKFKSNNYRNEVKNNMFYKNSKYNEFLEKCIRNIRNYLH